MSNYNIIQQGDTVQSYVIEAVCNSREDIESLPTDWLAGSSCFVIEDSSVFMLDLNGDWNEI